MGLTVQLALVFHVFIAVAVMVCGRHDISPGRAQMGPEGGPGAEVRIWAKPLEARHTLQPVVKVGGNSRKRRSWAPENGSKRSTALSYPIF